MTLKEDLAKIIHKHSRESDSDTPDYILGEYLLSCLEAFEMASNQRDNFYKHSHTMFEVRSNGKNGK